MIRLQQELREYASGHRRSFDFPLRLVGSPLQGAVWRQISPIPLGETSSYSAQAEALGLAPAVRAVASAIGKKPFPILIPCHRVVRKDHARLLLGGMLGVWS